MIIEERLPKIRLKEKTEEIAKGMHMQLLREGKSVYFNASGSSMYPFIKDGDTLKVVRIKEEDIKIGDLISVDNKDRSNAWFYAHRVIEIFRDNDMRFYVTKGDAQKRCMDEPVRFGRIAGKVTEIERNGLKINLEHPLWERYLNRRIAGVSARHGSRLRALAPYISLIIEWRWFFSKLGRRIRRIDESAYNAEELLLICARTDIDKSSIGRARWLLKRGIEWDFFMKTATRKGMAFMIYNSLNKIDYPALIPREFIDRLKTGYLSAVPEATVQERETKRLLGLFFQKNIPAVPLKGPILSGRLYSDIAARGISRDIDLLIEEKNREKAREVLEEAGCIFNRVGEIKTGQLWQYVFKNPDGAMVDLHWEINPTISRTERVKEFWRGTRLRKEGDICYYEFGEEELLLQLSMHLTGWIHIMQLRYICDINELLSRYRDTLDWVSIVEKARRLKLSHTLYATLLLSQTLLGSCVPKEVLAKLKPGLMKQIFIKTFVNRRVVLYKDSRRRRFLKGFLWYLFSSLLEAESMKDYFVIFFPPKEKMKGRSYLQRLTKGIVRFRQGLSGGGNAGKKK